MKLKLFVILAAMLLLAIMACSSGGGGSSSNNSTGNSTGASATIGPAGGVIEVTDTSSLLYGVKVDIPAGALDTDTRISITIQTDEPPLPTYLKKASVMVSLSPEGTSFKVPVTISIPYNSNNVKDPNMLAVYTFDTIDSSWDILTLKDMGTGVAEAITQHFSTFLVGEYIQSLPGDGDSDFTPNKNGFIIPNFYDKKNNIKGRCWGMVAFSAWYFENKKTDTNLYAKYINCEAISVSNETQNYIDVIRPDVNWALGQSAAYVKNTLMMMIMQKKPKPLILSLDNSPSYHAVLVYKYVTNPDSSVDFYVYDPNHPYNPQKPDDCVCKITYKDGTFQPYVQDYGSFNRFQLVSDLDKLSLYEKIYNLEMMPKINNIVTPASGATIIRTRPYDKITVSSQGKASGTTYDQDGKPHAYSSTGGQNGTLTRNTVRTISATVTPGRNISDNKIRNIAVSDIVMSLDNKPIAISDMIYEYPGNGDIKVSYATKDDLVLGSLTVYLVATDETLNVACKKWTFNAVDGCADISGPWLYYGRMSGSNTTDGNTQNFDDPVSGTLNIVQDGCNIGWYSLSSESCSTPMYRTGTINGNTAQATGLWTCPCSSLVENIQNYSLTFSYK